MYRETSVRFMVAAWLCAAVAAVPAARAQTAAPPAPEKAKTPEAQACYDEIVANYMQGKFEPLREQLKTWIGHRSELSLQQQKDVFYIDKACRDHRPSWWSKTRSMEPITFAARIWRKDFKVNYMPSSMLGAMAPIGMIGDKLAVIVTWRPHMVDSPTKFLKGMPRLHGLCEGDLAEAIVWHELGHNYICLALSPEALLECYQKHPNLFSCLQEFYADMTAMYYCSPAGRRALLMSRGSLIVRLKAGDPHSCPALAMGTLILHQVLLEPEKWPSFHLPSKMVGEAAEQSCIRYMFVNLDPNYTLREDRALREVLGNYVWRHGADMLRSGGSMPLPSGHSFRFYGDEDNKVRPRRISWVVKQLEKARIAGLTDDPNSGNLTFKYVTEGVMESAVGLDWLVTIEPKPTTQPTTQPTTKPAATQADPEAADESPPDNEPKEFTGFDEQPKPPASQPAETPKPKPPASQPAETPKPEPKPKPKPKPEPKPSPSERDAEGQAAKLLRNAESFLNNNAKSLGKKYLLQVVEKYPDTQAAERAEDLLLELELEE